MALTSGTRLGPYEILAPLGAGGMGEVYRAKDPRLGREVAIKVLPASFSADPDRLRRFEQEAQAAGVLNHPNIIAVYDTGTHEGAPYVVQELLEGETLRSALAGGRLPPRKAIDYASQIARGLAAAHEKGIVHRDLKPENLFLTREGRIKILDFGLAKLTRPEDAKTPHSRLPTETAGTEPGVVLGTIAYMSPEQARGQPADARSDLFSFGAVLFEMLSGARPFSGGTAADTMSSILREDPPDVSTVSPGVSTALEMIVRHCLEKSVEQRFQSARDLAFALEAISIGPEASSAAIAAAAVPKRPSRQGAWILAGALALAAAAFFAGRNLRPAAPGPPALRFLTTSGRDGQPAVSPDGKIIAFVSSRTGLPRIWLKQLSGGAEVALTEGPDNFPRFSPDGSEVLFTRTESGKPVLYRIASVGGTPRRILEGALDADWSPDGRHIAFVGQRQPQTSANVGVVRADGSGSRVLAEFKNFGAHSPRWSPDGRSICAAVGIGRQPWWFTLIDAESGRQKVLQPVSRAGQLSAPAWNGDGKEIVYVQLGASMVTNEGQIALQDTRSGAFRVLSTTLTAAQGLDLAPDGCLVVESETARESLLEVEPRSGSPVSAGRFLTRGFSIDRQPLFSPSGDRLLFNSNRDGGAKIWELSIQTGALHRLTDDPADDSDPFLSRDGKTLLWSSSRSRHPEVWAAQPDGSQPRQVTKDGVAAENPSLSADGRWIIYVSFNPEKRGIWKIRPDGTDDTFLAQGIVPEISPDGQWVAYQAGGLQIRVVRLANGSPAPFAIELPPSPGGFINGRMRWMPNGRSLAFLAPGAAGSNGIFVQDFDPGHDTSASRRPVAGFDPSQEVESFAISPDGKRFVLAVHEHFDNLLEIRGLPQLQGRRPSR